MVAAGCAANAPGAQSARMACVSASLRTIPSVVATTSVGLIVVVTKVILPLPVTSAVWMGNAPIVNRSVQ